MMVFVHVACSVLCKGESVSPYPQELPVSRLYLLSVQCSPCLPLPQELQAVCWYLAALCVREGIPLSSAVSKILTMPADSGQGLGELGERRFVESSAFG